MKKIFALLIAAVAAIAVAATFAGCSSETYITYTLYDGSGNSVGAYQVSEDPAAASQEEGYEEPEIEAEDGYYFAVTGYSGNPVNVVIPEEYCGIPVTAIGSSAFEGSSSLLSVKIADSVTTMGTACFLFCSKLTDVTLPSGITSLPRSAFAYCSLLTEITIPDGVTSLGQYCFFYCSYLESVVLPDSVEIFGSYAFQYCYELTSINMPSALTHVGAYCFHNCVYLTEAKFSDSLEYVGYAAFQNCQSLATVELGSGVTEICEYAFYYCLALTEVTLSDGLEYIGANAFAYCPLTDVYLSSTFPGGATKICWLYTANLSDEEDSNGYESGYLAPGSDNASGYLSSFNHLDDGVTAHAGYLTEDDISDSERMATLLTDDLMEVYLYFVAQ